MSKLLHLTGSSIPVVVVVVVVVVVILQVFTISLLADKKYHQFRPVLDAYIEGLFGATKAHV